jgi:radical SAM superfamily enzyme YgiQ (UPF0313 family)
MPGQPYIKVWQMEPLATAYIAGLTSDDIDITFWDDRMEKIDFDHPADLVALTVETYTAKRAYQIASEYRRRGIPVVMGGVHPTLVPEEVMHYAEAIVVGEGEDLWPVLIADFMEGRLKRIYKTASRPDISEVLPDRSIFGNRKYFPLGLIDASRGCTYKCDFCTIQEFFDSTQNWRGIDALLEDIKRVRRKNKLFFFVDDNIIANTEKAHSFFEALIPLKIKWLSQADISITYDEETLKLMKASGCEGILIGFESFNVNNLKKLNKGFNADRDGSAEAVRKLLDHKIRLYATFIFGCDHDTPDVFREVLDFCIEHKVFIVGFNHITPFPGTPLYQRLENEGRLLYDKWWLDDRYRYGQIPFRTTMPAEDIQRKCRELRAAFYSVRSIYQRFLHPINHRNLSVSLAYLFINFLLRNDVSQRFNLPLGDSAFNGKIITVSGSGERSVKGTMTEASLGNGL